MKRVWLTSLLVALLLSVITTGNVWAQATAQISGAVQDPTGAVLPGVEITATQTDTGVSRMTVSNETGYYTLSNLQLGPYKIEASLPGFRSFLQTGIVLQVNSSPTLNITLQVGQVSEQVEVQANASLVETRNVSVGQVMETARIMELPLNGRNAQELLLLGGGAVQSAPAGGMVFPSNRLAISSAGTLGTAGEYTLDGIRHVDPYDGVALPLPFPDALAEFKTELGGVGAQQGRASQMSAVTKSGTNDFHGDLFEFVRNDLFNARSYFATKGSSLKRNQFGGTAGGPIIKNKLFFFAGYQGTILRQDPSDTRQFVPTAAMLAGDFTAFTAPACNGGRQITLRAPYVNNRIDPALLDPVALKVIARLPKAQDACGQVTFGKKTNDDQRQFISKIDYQKSAKHSIFGRFLFSDDIGPSPFTFTPDNPLNASNSSDAVSYAFTAGSTYLISATTVNAFRVAFSREHLLTTSPSSFDITQLGSKVYSGYAPGIAKLTVTSGFSTPGQGRRNFGINFYQVSDDISTTKGKHQFGYGVRIGHSRTNVALGANVLPTFNFTGATTGLGLADFLAGKPSDFNQGSSIDIFTRTNYVSLYVQDTWQLRPRLTMSYGLRWAPILPQRDVHRPVPYVLNFDVNRFAQGIRSTVFVNAPPGMLFPGDAGFVQHNNGANAAKPEADIWNPYWKDLAPRIGLAWDPKGDGKTSLRASYGITYDDYPTVDRLGSQSAEPPYGSLTRVIAPVGGFDDPWAGIAGGNPFPTSFNRDSPFVPLGEYMPANPYLSPTYDQSWNLSVQREIVPGTLVSVSYLGTKVIHLQYSTPLNQSVYIPGNADAGGNCFLNGKLTPVKVAAGTACSTLTNTQDRRVLSMLNPAFKGELGRVGTVTSGGVQNYSGMLISLQRRVGRGYTVGTNYTLSHCVGDYSARSNGGYGASVDHTYQDANNRHKDYGNCESDQRHNFNLTAVAETPKFANRTLSLVGTGWRLSGLYRLFSTGTIVQTSQSSGVRTVTLGAASGSNASASSSADRCLCDISGQRPDLLLPNAIYLDKSGRPGTQWLNPAAFGQPALGTLGNLGRTNMRLPMTWQFDMALSRVFRFRENQSLEFRTEAFNVLNSFRLGDPNGGVPLDMNLSSAQFGKVRLSLDPRILQFAMKYIF